jgi:hypothetical protein
VESGVVGLNAVYKLEPGCGSEELAGFNGLRNELSALSEYLTGAESVVSNLGVTHIIITGKAYSSTVSTDSYHRIVSHKVVESGSVCSGNSVCAVIGSDTYTVHNNGKKRTFYTVKFL